MKMVMKQKFVSNMSPALCWALIAGIGIAFIFGVIQFVLIFGVYGFFPALIAGLVILAAAAAASIVLTLLFSMLKNIRLQTLLVFFFSLFLCLLTMALGIFLVPLLVSVMASVYLAVMFTKGRYRDISKWKKILRYALLGLFGILSLFILVLILMPGPSLNNRPEQAALALPYTDRIQNAKTDLENPAESGTYRHTILYYASEKQKIEPYPEQEIISARTVDASGFLDGWSGIRKSQLGFGPETLPLNGQVWMPEGSGPFPLVLIVHGNHDLGDRSDGGYAYLGELLASRGIIAVSADENFLNSSSLYDALFFARLKEENDARAFVLLEHLRQWHDWNADASSPFFNKVDFENIALIGHSRGGEAVSLAASFAELKVYPDNGSLTFDYPFRIKSLAAIAPVHGQYNPAGLEVNLENINYLVLHGAHDMDVSSFHGANMYRRTDVSGGGIKAQVWMQYANHGQFNSTWGTNDSIGLMNLTYNRKLLMPMEEQQQAAKATLIKYPKR